MPRTPVTVLTAAAVAVGPIALLGGQQAVAAPVEIHVATTGNDNNPGTLAAPKRTVQAAVDLAKPGTVIRVHKGTYNQQIFIRTSGTPTAPITLTNAGDGEAVLTSQQEPDDCAATKPSQRRTIRAEGETDWIFRGLTIVNGAFIVGDRSDAAFDWHYGRVLAQDWVSRRKVPGRGVNNPDSTPLVVPYLRTLTGKAKMKSADRIQFWNNTIRGRGVYLSLGSYGQFRNNKVSDLICGSGPGFWLMTFSDHWTIRGNDISRISPSSITHYMHEGIRIGTASNYNYVAENVVHDLEGDGRGINTDVDSSYNLIQFNKVANVAIGYNDQMAGWGNVWQYNEVRNFRQLGFGVRLKDFALTLPSKDTSANGIVVRCNRALLPVDKAKSLGVGGVMGARIAGNNFTSSWVSPNATAYWRAYDNLFNGGTQPPGPVVEPATC
ncbi:MAG: DUF1565 domain-containing protein [Actinobacteria bacterium]|nr:DUF1565 domain-containing protein [Actinomycetota bacterium]